jgi:hypothetical protein
VTQPFFNICPRADLERPALEGEFVLGSFRPCLGRRTLDKVGLLEGGGRHMEANLAGAKLAWRAARIDDQANIANRPCITLPENPVSVWVISSNEELMIAPHTAASICSLASHGHTGAMPRGDQPGGSAVSE